MQKLFRVITRATLPECTALYKTKRVQNNYSVSKFRLLVTMVQTRLNRPTRTTQGTSVDYTMHATSSDVDQALNVTGRGLNRH